MKAFFHVMMVCFLYFFVATKTYAVDAIRIEAGSGDSSVEVYKVGLQKNFNKIWMASDTGKVTGFWELGFSFWNADNEPDKDMQVVSFAPVLVYEFNNSSSRIHPYIDGGIGVAYLSETRIADIDLGMHFQFESRFSFGVRLGVQQQHDLSISARHVSNASLDDENDGMNTVTGAYTYRF